MEARHGGSEGIFEAGVVAAVRSNGGCDIEYEGGMRPETNVAPTLIRLPLKKGGRCMCSCRKALGYGLQA